MPVPFIDLTAQNDRVRGQVIAGIAKVYDRGEFTNGTAVAEFEQAFGEMHGGSCVAVGSGLDALRLALIGAGIRPGWQVAVPAMTFAATWEAVMQAGARVVPVDVDQHGSMSALGLTEALEHSMRDSGDPIRGIVPVHLYGRASNVLPIPGVPIVEDACQAHGVSPLPGVAAAAFSFYPTKNLGGIGDGGAIVFDPELVDGEKLRALREHGQIRKGSHRWPGWTSRLDTVQAVALLAKLPYLPRWNAQRAEAARLYDRELRDIGQLHLPPLEGTNVWHLYPVLAEDRDGLARHLTDLGIGTGIHYRGALHVQKAFPAGYLRGDFPWAERIADESLSLPLFPGITEAQQEEVCTAIRGYFDRGVAPRPAARPAPAHSVGTASPRIHPTATVHPTANVYGDCEIGAGTTIAAFVEVQGGAKIGEFCKISSHAFVCDGVTIEDGVFIGHGVTFTNDRQPRAMNLDGELLQEGEWKLERTLVRACAAIGSNATILPVEIGERAMVAAGAVVTRNVAANATVAGNPARQVQHPIVSST